jgi:hypothetical protein
MDPTAHIGISGGYFTYINLWCGLVECLVGEARDALRGHLAKKATEKRIHRWLERQPRSLNPAPDVGAVAAQWRRTRGSLVERLRFGSMLMDLEPAVDNSPILRMNRACTREVIVARNPGVKGWLHQHCREVGYATAMRHKSLAHKLQRACGLPREVPLSWILPGGSVPQGAQGAPSAKTLAAARVRLLELLAECGNAEGLSERLDDILGTVRRTLKVPRRGLTAAGRRRLAERSIETWLEPIRRHVATATAGGGLDPALRATLRARLLAVAAELGAPPGVPAA